MLIADLYFTFKVAQSYPSYLYKYYLLQWKLWVSVAAFCGKSVTVLSNQLRCCYCESCVIVNDKRVADRKQQRRRQQLQQQRENVG